MNRERGVAARHTPRPPEAGDSCELGLPEGLRQLSARRRMRRYLRLLAVLFDIMAIAVAFVCANAVWTGDPFHGQGLNILLVILPSYLTIAANKRIFTIASVAHARKGGGNAVLAFMIA